MLRRTPGSHLPVAVSLALLGFVSASRAVAQCPCAAAEVVVCGHRGTGVNDPDNPYPENTLPSFRQAVLEGADMIELDVHHSADGVLVVHHDPSIDDTTDGTGCIGSMSLAELRQLDAGAATGMAGTGVTIPTLDEVLSAIQIDVNIEIKYQDAADCPASDRARLAADVVRAIGTHAGARRIVVSSFDAGVLTEVERLDSAVHTSLLSTRADSLAEAMGGGFDGFNPFVIAATPELVSAAHAAGLDVGVWTVNDETEIGALFDSGVEMIISDQPDLVAATRRSRCETAGCPLPPPPAPPPPPAAGGDDGGCSTVRAGAGHGGSAALVVFVLLALRAGRARRRQSIGSTHSVSPARASR